MATTTSSSSPGSSSSIVSEFETSANAICNAAEAPKFNQTTNGGNSIFPSMLQYAATLASLAQQMNFLQHPGMAQTLPLLYPHLYQSLLTFPNIDTIRKMVQSAPATPESKLNSSEIPSEPKAHTTTNVSRKRARKDESPTLNGNSSTPKKHRAIRRLKFDEEKSSPVSGTFIRPEHEMPIAIGTKPGGGDIDPALNVVEVTEEAQAALAKIPNLIGAYICQLCKAEYLDAFRLAAHCCPRIGHVEYRCDECDKVFSCPANLASHQRWHKPGGGGTMNRSLANGHRTNGHSAAASPLDLSTKGPMIAEETASFKCEQCGRKFTRHAYLRNHAISAHCIYARSQANGENGIEKADEISTELDIEEFPCPLCDHWFHSGAALEEHLQTYAH